MWLQNPTIFGHCGEINSLTYWIYMELMRLGRVKNIKQSHQCLSWRRLKFRCLLESYKHTNHLIVIKFQQKCFKHVLEDFFPRFTNLLTLLGVRRNYLTSGRRQSLSRVTGRVIKQNVLNAEACHCYKPHTECYPSCSEGQLRLPETLLGIISEDIGTKVQLPVAYSSINRQGNYSQ